MVLLNASLEQLTVHLISYLLFHEFIQHNHFFYMLFVNHFVITCSFAASFQCVNTIFIEVKISTDIVIILYLATPEIVDNNFAVLIKGPTLPDKLFHLSHLSILQ